jgi:bifunctional N-acetylglucosamine-1-phosphate-uridyltransferase/glucosamine-1-phosphate-acetyltransferase GlmU-like protein
VIPAAGRGSRLRSELPKVLVPVNGRPMLDHLVDLYGGHVDSVVLVVHPAFRDDVVGAAARFDTRIDVAEQPAATGMLDAILIGAHVAEADAPDRLWVTWCDQVAIDPRTVQRLADAESTSALAFPTVVRQNPYIHFERNAHRGISAVRQRREGDTMPERGESDIGLFALSAEAAFESMPRFAATARPGAGTAERNFLPFIPWIAATGAVVTIAATDVRESIGINTPEELTLVSRYLQARTVA